MDRDQTIVITVDASEALRVVEDIAQIREAEVGRLRQVIKLLEADVREAHERARQALGTRDVLCGLLGECLPLLEYDAQETHCGPSHDGIVELIGRIEAARDAVMREGLHLAALDAA